MKKIKLTQNKYALVDNEDFDYLNQFHWQFDGFYAGRCIRINNKKTRIRMHRELVNVSKGLVTDHINKNKLDNRKKNLKICTQSENQKNMKKFITNKSGVTGVYWDNERNKWAVQKCFNGKRKMIGRFDELIKAEKVYKNYLLTIK
jgi:hypothetical protein